MKWNLIFAGINVLSATYNVWMGLTSPVNANMHFGIGFGFVSLAAYYLYLESASEEDDENS